MRKFAAGQKVKIKSGMFQGMTGVIKPPGTYSEHSTFSQETMDEYYSISLGGEHPMLRCHEDQFECLTT